MNLSQAVKKTRSRRFMTQKDLAEKTGLNVRTIQRIENNKVIPSLYSKKMLCEILRLNKVFNRYYGKVHSLIIIGLVIIIVSIVGYYIFKSWL
jgi:DNA-binding XRE family transcriptional regulator